jgi:sugar phosphate isomerase/epimerase
MAEKSISRRSFANALALGAAGVSFGMRGPFGAPSAGSVTPRRGHASPLRLGIASYSLRKFPRDKAIEMVKSLGTPFINLKSVHLPYELSQQEIAAARREIEDAGLRIVGGGLITFEQDTDDAVQRYFEYASRAGMPLIVGTCDPAVLPRVERFAKQYDIQVAIHNHGPGDTYFPTPHDVLKYVRTMDRRLGLCIDLGHTVRTGTDVVRAIADAGARVLDVHAKDLRDLKDEGSQCIVGQGAIPIADVFRQLDAMGYAGFVNLEYEIDEDDPLPGMRQSLAYMRGVIAGLGMGR